MNKPTRWIATVAALTTLGIASATLTTHSTSSTSSSSTAPSTASTLSQSTDPFASMDKIFEMQMRQMEQMRRQMDAMFRGFEQSFQMPSLQQTPRLIHSSGVFSSGFVDKGDHYELAIRVNDLKNSKVDITSENGMITIAIRSQNKQEQTRGNYGKVISFASSSSTQSFTLPPDADEATIKAEQKENVITVTLAKKKGASTRAKVIPITQKEANKTK
jgi:HSP20 family molecular chaperone IbpA